MRFPQATPALGAPQASRLLSSISISDAFDVADIGIEDLSLTTPHIGALKARKGTGGGHRGACAVTPPLCSVQLLAG
jgi:hypothetical protein